MNGKRIGETLLSIIKALFKGELLIRIGADKYFSHIIYAFLLIGLLMWVDYNVDQALIEVENNRKVLSELKIYHAEKTSELVRLNRVSTIQANLKALGSDVDIAEKPATVINKK